MPQSFPLGVYVTSPRAKILISTTHQGYLEMLLKRLDKRTYLRALPADLPEWRWVDASAPQWGVRHYDPNDAKFDPTSPIGHRDGWYAHDDDAIGLAYSSDPQGKVITVRHLSRRRRAVDSVRKFWENDEFGKKPSIREVEKGALEIKESPEEEQGHQWFGFLLALALGHGAAL